MNAETPHIVEATPETFQRDAIERSSELPVVVDFWAEWCQPCQLLGPTLEKLAAEYGGKFLLVKADTERLPDVAAQFGVRSIPTVLGLKDGAVVDGFVGLLHESAIRAFLDRLLPTPADQAYAEARALEATDPSAAEARHRAALELAPDEPRARIGLARSLLAQGRPEESRTILETLARRGFLEPEAEKLQAELTLRGLARETGGVDAARAAVAAAPSDLAARLRLAEALAVAGVSVEALDLCLDLVERDRRGVGESARKAMLAIFQLLPQDSPIVGDYRRRLSVVL